MGLKTLDLKDVAKILIIYSQFSNHTMLNFRVSTFQVILYYHIYFLLTESTYDLLKKIFCKQSTGFLFLALAHPDSCCILKTFYISSLNQRSPGREGNTWDVSQPLPLAVWCQDMESESLFDASEKPGTYIVNQANRSQQIQKKEPSSGVWRILFLHLGMGQMRNQLCALGFRFMPIIGSFCIWTSDL